MNCHQQISNLIRRGKLVKLPCETCGNNNVVAHHDDYLKPRDVRWLCTKCHAAWHRENGQGLNREVAMRQELEQHTVCQTCKKPISAAWRALFERLSVGGFFRRGVSHCREHMSKTERRVFEYNSRRTLDDAAKAKRKARR